MTARKQKLELTWIGVETRASRTHPGKKNGATLVDHPIAIARR